MVGRYSKILPLVLLLTVVLAGVPAGAGHGTSEPSVVRGHVFDAFGRGIRVDVCAHRKWTGAPVEHGTFSSSTDGSYEIPLPADRTYRLTAIDDVLSSDENCQEGSHGPIWHEIKSIDPFVPPDWAGMSVDFHLRYVLHAWIKGYAGDGAARPGDTVELTTRIAETAGPVSVFWQDPLGNEVALEPVPTFAETFQEFGATYIVPASLEDGSYPTAFRVESASGTEIADPHAVTLHVDTVPPSLTSTSPADGEEVTALQPQSIRFAGADDRSGVACNRSSAALTDLASGSVIEIDVFSTIDGRCRSRSSYPLIAGHEYRVDLTISDAAGNTTPGQFSFVAYDGPAWTDNAPAGGVLSPVEPIQVRYSPDVRPVSIRFRITWLTGEVERTVIPQIDAQNRLALVRPGDVSTIGFPLTGNDDFYPPLLPGRYRVEVTGEDLRAQPVAPISWEFVVATG